MEVFNKWSGEPQTEVCVRFTDYFQWFLQVFHFHLQVEKNSSSFGETSFHFLKMCLLTYRLGRLSQLKNVMCYIFIINTDKSTINFYEWVKLFKHWAYV